MKKISILILALICTIALSAQDNAITRYFTDYQSDASFTKVNVSSKMFSLFTEIEGEDDAEKAVLDAMSKLKGVKALINDNSSDGASMYRDALKRLNTAGDYEELMSVEDETENVMFMIRNTGDIISELLMVLRGSNDFMIMSLYGEIDLNQIAKISRILKISGLEEFGKLGG